MPSESASSSFGRSRGSGEVGDVAGSRLANSVPASGTRGCRRSEDGLAGRPVAMNRRVEELDLLRGDSTTMRGTEQQRGLALQFNCFPNPYGAEKTMRKTTSLQRIRKTRNLCVEMPRSVFAPALASQRGLWDERLAERSCLWLRIACNDLRSLRNVC